LEDSSVIAAVVVKDVPRTVAPLLAPAVPRANTCRPLLLPALRCAAPGGRTASHRPAWPCAAEAARRRLVCVGWGGGGMKG